MAARRAACLLAFSALAAAAALGAEAREEDVAAGWEEEALDVVFDEGAVGFYGDDDDVDSVTWWRVETVDELKHAIASNAANVSIERDITMDMPIFDTPIRREMTVRGDVGDWCKTQREGSCMIGSKNGQIFLVHPPFGLLHLKNMILQGAYAAAVPALTWLSPGRALALSRTAPRSGGNVWTDTALTAPDTRRLPGRRGLLHRGRDARARADPAGEVRGGAQEVHGAGGGVREGHVRGGGDVM